MKTHPLQKTLGFFLACLMTVSAVSARTSAETGTEVQKPKTRKIALTFDDGPHPVLTPQILTVLSRYGVKATFFMIGKNAENYPETARQVAKEGHEIGNHTYSHCRLDRLNGKSLEEELNHCSKTLENVCGVRPVLVRPPEGGINAKVRNDLRQNGYGTVLWNIDTRDWEVKNTEKIVRSVLENVRGGEIILMHDYIGHQSKTPEALEKLLPELLARGFEPVTVSELLSAI